jgi:hydroxymethylglutaryl-CoA reductase (NADPH)
MTTIQDPDAIPFKNDYSEQAKNACLDFLAQKSNQNFNAIPASTLRSDDMKGRVENFIGAVQIPVGLAGPLYFKGTDAQGMI